MAFVSEPSKAVVSSNNGFLKDAKGRFQPGTSGGAGRPKGARHKLGEAFIQGMLTAYEERGLDAIREVRDSAPAKFLHVLAAILPKQVELEADVNVRVSSAVDSLVTRLATLSKRETEYAEDREPVKTIEHDPVGDTAARITRFDLQGEGSGSNTPDNVPVEHR